MHTLFQLSVLLHILILMERTCMHLHLHLVWILKLIFQFGMSWSLSGKMACGSFCGLL